jgi:DNA-binding XRE family transcriptional regulator
MIDKILEWFPEEELLKIDGFDDAIIGIDEANMRLIYSSAKIVDILKEEMSEEDAIEHFEYNIKGAWVGEKTPIYCIEIYRESMKTHELIKSLRTSANYNQWYVAKHLNVTQPEYSKIENGKRKKISIELIKKIIELYKIETDVFFK